MSKLDDLISKVIQREGGYSNHPADRGGPTNHGITQDTLAAWRGHPVSAADVQALGQAEAREIYRANYFEKPGFGAIEDPELQEFMFDAAVNHGPGAAAKLLQTALQRMGFYTAAIDGGFGPLSQAAVKAAEAAGRSEGLYYRTKCERFEAYMRFIGRDPSQSVFATGWANRLDTLEDAA